jgi:hypothetical protein
MTTLAQKTGGDMATYFSLEIVARAPMPSERSREDALARRRELQGEGRPMPQPRRVREARPA